MKMFSKLILIIIRLSTGSRTLSRRTKILFSITLLPKNSSYGRARKILEFFGSNVIEKRILVQKNSSYGRARKILVGSNSWANNLVGFEDEASYLFHFS